MYNADLPAASMRAKRRKLKVDPTEANAVALQPEVDLVALQPEVDLVADLAADLAVQDLAVQDDAVQEQNKQSRVQKDR